MHEQNLKIVAWILGLALLLGGGFYGAHKLIQREEMRERVSRANNRIEPLVDAAAKLKKAAESYQAKMVSEGVPLPPGKIISLEDLEASEILKKEELNRGITVEAFSYKMLPYDAPGEAIQMVVVTDQGRATMRKNGEGALHAGSKR